MYHLNTLEAVREQFSAGLDGSAAERAATTILLADETWPNRLEGTKYILIGRSHVTSMPPSGRELGMTFATGSLRFDWDTLMEDFGIWNVSGGDNMPWSDAAAEEIALLEAALIVSPCGPLTWELRHLDPEKSAVVAEALGEVIGGRHIEPQMSVGVAALLYENRERALAVLKIFSGSVPPTDSDG